ncbi:MAG: SpoIID/LytB domain-containing protein [Lachnospiraceae bacterium]|nr:SpoIID/LytB domain-containing protein [Lachnospiraceae bacterium]
MSAVIALIIGVSAFDSIRIHAGSARDIRVGLTSLYGKKDIITIYNDLLAVGYCKDNSFTVSEILRSSFGFSFEPDRNDWYIGSTVYNSYKNASFICSEMKNAGYTALPCMYANRQWKIYVLIPADFVASFNLSDYGSEFKDMTLLRSGPKSLIHAESSDYEFLIDGTVDGYPQFKAVNSRGEQVPVSLGTRKYRGRIELVRESDKLTAVNVVGIEAYLLGVITCEMGASKPAEALKAQAICSRSYAAAKAGFDADSKTKEPYKMNDTDASQVYKGVNAETDASYDAVRSTIGQVIRNKSGNIVEAFYFSTDGGATDSISDIWGYADPVYESVFDPYETDPEVGPWIEEYTLTELSKNLKDSGHDVGEVTDLSVTVTTAGGRAYSVLIRGTNGKTTVSGNTLREILGLPSTKFRIITADSDLNTVYAIDANGYTNPVIPGESYVISENSPVSILETSTEQYILVGNQTLFNIPDTLPPAGSVYIIGMGKGHGVGMSQSGAAGMARQGFDHTEIINYFYHNITIGKY